MNVNGPGKDPFLDEIWKFVLKTLLLLAIIIATIIVHLALKQAEQEGIPEIFIFLLRSLDYLFFACDYIYLIFLVVFTTFIGVNRFFAAFGIDIAERIRKLLEKWIK